MAERGRTDPYKGFNFRVAIGTVLAGIAGFAIVKKLIPKVAARYLKPKDYVSDTPATGRPIEAVGTTVAAGRTAPKSKGRGTSRRSAIGHGAYESGHAEAAVRAWAMPR